MIKVLFVCTGNICRSPTAEGVFRHLLREAGLEKGFFVNSAGTDSFHAGEKPDARAIRTAKKHGIAIETQKARRLEDADYKDFDYIFAMDGGHFHEISARAPQKPKAALRMFLEEGDVPDPWYGEEADFEHAYRLIHAGAKTLLDKMKEDHDL